MTIDTNDILNSILEDHDQQLREEQSASAAC